MAARFTSGTQSLKKMVCIAMESLFITLKVNTRTL